MACTCTNGEVIDEGGVSRSCVICNPPKTTGYGRALAEKERIHHANAKAQKEQSK